MTHPNIIFDLDGTLIDSARLTGLIIDEMLADRGVPEKADRAIIRAMDGVGGEAMIEAVMGPHSCDPQRDLDEFRARHRDLDIPHNLAFPGVVDALEQIRRCGSQIAICSNKPQDLCEKILLELRIAHHFTAIIGSEPARPKKPAPDAALLALGAIRGDREDTFFCGDSVVDVLTARAASLQVVMVSWGYGRTAALQLDPLLPEVETMATLVEIAHGTRTLGSLLRG